jgi:hypothetical protein
MRSTKIALGILLISGFVGWSQIQLETQFLPKKIDETSGLEFYGDHLLTHNDSGDKPKLYVFNTAGELLLETKVYGTVNRDWEDIAADACQYFIADVGNNNGQRKDLTIYILNSRLVLEDSIQLRYKDQKNFTKRKQHGFDAEALTVVGDSLMLFSKDRERQVTQLYVFPKVGGSYTLTSIGELPANSLITAADYQDDLKLLALTGYNAQGEQFFYTMTDFSYHHLDKKNFKRYQLPLDRAQIEAVKIIDTNHFWITSEDEGNGYPRLFKLTLFSF